MPPRRSHKKSRNGCDQCKKRRVKCNEDRPCLNCSKRGLPCRYEDQSTPSDTGQHPNGENHLEPWPWQNPASIADGKRCQLSTQTEDALCSLQNIANPARFPQEWNVQDPELMHHYCTATAKSLTPRKEIRRVWQIALPKIAYSYEFLMHGILSLSALHLTYLKPERHSHYLTCATFHLGLGLQTFRAVLRSPTEENCCALFSFSCLIIIWICAAPTDSDDRRPLDSTIELFNLCRGILSLRDFMSVVKKSSLQPLFWPYYAQESGSLVNYTPSYSRLFLGLDESIRQLRHLVASEPIDEGEKAIYNHALSELESSFRSIENAEMPAECGMVFIWPLSVRDEFVNCIEQKSPIALILLAYYSAQMHCFSHFWFIERQPNVLLSRISAILPARLGTWLEWPRRFCTVGCLCG